jgi:hypothetical protein
VHQSSQRVCFEDVCLRFLSFLSAGLGWGCGEKEDEEAPKIKFRIDGFNILKALAYPNSSVPLLQRGFVQSKVHPDSNFSSVFFGGKQNVLIYDLLTNFQYQSFFRSKTYLSPTLLLTVCFSVEHFLPVALVFEFNLACISLQRKGVDGY